MYAFPFASFRAQCRLHPIVDVAGHTPAELEEEYGAERAWEFEEGGDFTGDISEGREREFDEAQAGIDHSLAESLDQAVMMEYEEGGGLFEPTGEISQVEAGRGMPRVKPFEVVSELETPDLGVPESQFELPIEEERIKRPRTTIERRAVNKHTEIFRR